MAAMAEELEQIRKSLGYSQSAMAHQLGITLRAYQDIEGDKVRTKLAYLDAARLVAAREAVGRGDPMLAPPELRQIALDLAGLLRGAPQA